MECERLQKLVRNWYAQVQDEAMAPARMAAFMDNHLAQCQVCLADPLVKSEVEKIKAMLLPPAAKNQAASQEGAAKPQASPTPPADAEDEQEEVDEDDEKVEEDEEDEI